MWLDTLANFSEMYIQLHNLDGDIHGYVAGYIVEISPCNKMFWDAKLKRLRRQTG